MSVDQPEDGSIPDEIVVPPEDAGKRIDVFLRDRLPGSSRAHVREEIARGHIALNGRSVRKSAALAAGDCVGLALFRGKASCDLAADHSGRLSVLHEDEWLLVVKKEAGLPTLPKNREDSYALACRLVARYPELRSVGPPLEAGLLHRLDTDTSGLLVAARDEETYRHLRSQWKWRRVEKEYLALARGEVSRSFTVLLRIGHHPRSARRMIATEGGRSAESYIRPLGRSAGWSLLLVSLRDGRRHQIRVHLAESGHPVAGDPLYGRGRGRDGVPRLMLHASRLRFRGSVGSEHVQVVCAPPQEFMEAVTGKLGAGGRAAMVRYFERYSKGL